MFNGVTCADDLTQLLVKHEDEGASTKMANRLEAMLSGPPGSSVESGSNAVPNMEP